MSRLATQSIRLSESDVGLIGQALNNVQIAGRDAHIVSDCLKKIEKVQKKFLANKPIPDEIIVEDNGQVTKV